MKNWILGILIPVLGSVTLFSCQKDTMDNELAAISEDLMLQKSEESINKDADMLSMKCPECNLEQMRACLPDCADITDSGTDSYPRTITIDYGDGCDAAKGPEKKGEMVIRITDELSNPGAERSMIFENFHIGDRQIMGTRTLTNITEGDAAAALFAYKHEMEMQGEKGLHRKSAEGTRQWISGFDTPENLEDDVFEMEGTASMTCGRGEGMSRSIIEPILVDQNCGYPVSGIVEITRKGETHSIDFGDGTCDNEAVLTEENGDTRIIDLDEMHMRKRRKH